MPEFRFLPENISIDTDANGKILAIARKAKIPIRFGCAACRCGTCAVEIIEGSQNLNEMKANERSLLEQMRLPTNGKVRLSCQARIETGHVTVDISFQENYDPEQGLDET